MSLKKTITSVAVTAGLIAMNTVSLASGAHAYDGRGHGYRDSYRGEQAYRHSPPPARSYHDDHADRQRKKDKAYARGLAIGLGAVILEGILAAEANRNRSADID